MATAPMAVADDDLAPNNADSSQAETPADEPQAPVDEPVDEPAEEAPVEEPTEETPSEEAPVETPAEDESIEDETLAASLPKAAALAETAADDAAESTVDGAEARAADIEPNYGERKIRIGVQLADGSYVTDGTTVDGSTFTISVKALDGGVTTATCTATGGSSYAECSPYYAAPGATVTITQDTVPPGVTKSNEAKVIEPCEDVLDDEQNPDYEDFADIDNCSDEPVYGTSAIFDVTGLLPATTSDTAGVKSGESVTIDVLANDDSEDPSTSLTIDTPPAHGTAVVTGEAAPQPEPEPEPEIEFRMGATAVAGAGTLQIVYTADEEFSGTDTFQYAVTNSNGTTTGTVTVEVEGDEVVTPPIDEEEPGGTDPGDDSDPVVDDSDDAEQAEESDESAAATPTTPATPTSATLPDAGGVDAKLAGYAALLLAGGGALTVAGRRRPGRHARVS
ncbi:MAG: hypothetical protein ABWZ99_08720 [Ilumatobacteraceae bacterium]